MESPEEIVRTLRKQAGLSQRDLAARAGTSQPAIASRSAVVCELDVMPQRDFENAERLAAALNSLAARGPREEAASELEGAGFLGWRSQRFETEAGPIAVVPHAAAIGGFEDVATIKLALGDLSVRVITIDEVIASKERLGRPKDKAALPALYAARDEIRHRRSE